MESAIQRKRKSENKINGSLQRPAKRRNGTKCHFKNCFLGEMSNSSSNHVKYYGETKKDLAEILYSYYNHTVFNGKLPANTELYWNPRIWKKAGVTRGWDDPIKGRCSRIDLSIAALHSPARLRDVMIHEVCHIAAWFLNGIRGTHGPVWLAYVKKAARIHPELPPITVYHNPEIS